MNYLPLGGRRRGFTLRASVSSSIIHRCVVLVFASPFPYLCLLFSDVDVFLIGFRLFINSVYSLCSFSAHFVFVIKLDLLILFLGVHSLFFIYFKPHLMPYQQYLENLTKTFYKIKYTS